MNNKSINIVHLTASLNIGGAEALLVDLIETLKKNNFKQTVLYFHDGPHRKKLEKRGISTHHIKGLFCTYDPIFIIRLWGTLYKLKPNCLHTLLWSGNFFGRIMGRILKIPTIQALHNNISQNGPIRTLLDKLTLSKNDSLIAVSHEVKQSHITFIPATQEKQITVIPNGIKPTILDKMNNHKLITRKQIGLKKEHFIIGSVGRFVPLKNYPLLLGEYSLLEKIHPHTRLLLIGYGPQEAFLRKKIKQLNLEEKVHIITGQKAVNYYHLMDCFIQPSYKEGISIALLEALQTGLPTIVGNSTQNHPVIKSGYNGLLITPEKSFMKALCQLIENPQKLKKLSTNGKKTVSDKFSHSIMAHNYEKIFRKYSQ